MNLLLWELELKEKSNQIMFSSLRKHLSFGYATIQDAGKLRLLAKVQEAH